MNIQDAGTVVRQLRLDFLGSREVVLEPVNDYLSTDGGLLVIREWDEKLGWTAGFTSQLHDDRNQAWVQHPVIDMVRSRVFGILAGYEDQNDHDGLRSDAVFKLISGRLPNEADLASQPTLSRFENAVSPTDLLALEEWFCHRFVSNLEQPKGTLMLDMDVFDDPTYGDQQLTFFHGFYEQYQYLVRVMTCANNDQVIIPTLLYGTARPTLGVDDDLRRIVTGVRARFPAQHIHFRADSGFATPAIYELCDELQIDFSIGLPMNAVLQRKSQELLDEAQAAFDETGRPQRLFTGFEYQAKSWSKARWVIVKCEVTAQGTNRRAVVTNRPGAQVCPGAAYDEYADRGESENRNKELKREFSSDRLSDHRYMANFFRLFLHCLANNLLVDIRQRCADQSTGLHSTRTDAGQLGSDPLPTEALAGRERRKHFNHRHRQDPLGEGHASTWRMMIIKVAARIKVTCRRVYVQVSGSWPYLERLLKLGDQAIGHRVETS